MIQGLPKMYKKDGSSLPMVQQQYMQKSFWCSLMLKLNFKLNYPKNWLLLENFQVSPCFSTFRILQLWLSSKKQFVFQHFFLFLLIGSITVLESKIKSISYCFYFTLVSFILQVSSIELTFETKYSRINQVKFAEDKL